MATEAFPLLQRYGASLVAFAAFALLHSVCAREPFKVALARCTGDFFVEHFWRLAYCVLSYAALYYGVSSLHWGRNPENDVWLIAYPEWLWQAMTVLHLGAIVLIYVAFLQSDYFEFLGFKQAAKGLASLFGSSPRPQQPQELFGSHRLVTTGVYACVRHPMMAGGLLFLLSSGPSLDNLDFTAMYAAYMLIGGYYEERRLVRIFGSEYIRYQARVGAFFPQLQLRAAG